MEKILKVVFAVATFVLLSAFATVLPSRISLVDANALALLAAAIDVPNLHKLRDLGTDSDPDNLTYPDFYFVSVTWSGRRNGDIIVGHYAVDRNTGDVWDAVECGRYYSREIVALKAKISSRSPTIASIRKMTAFGPECEGVRKVRIIRSKRR